MFICSGQAVFSYVVENDIVISIRQGRAPAGTLG
jgi:hypothetical protein